MAGEDFASLMQRVRAGHEEAATQLVERWGWELLRIIRFKIGRQIRRRFDSQDFSQMVWKTLFHHRDRLEGIDTVESLAGFLCSIAQHKVKQVVRANMLTTKRDLRCEEELDSKALVDPISVRVDAGSAMAAAETRDLLGEDAGPRGRRVLELRQDGCNLTDISKQLGINEKTVRRIMSKLRDVAIGAELAPGTATAAAT